MSCPFQSTQHNIAKPFDGRNSLKYLKAFYTIVFNYRNNKMNNTLNINSVDLDKIKSFTQEHINKIIANNKDTHPELYKENKYGKLIVIKAVDLKDIKWRGGVQTSQVGGARYAGGNPRHKEVENSIKQKV